MKQHARKKEYLLSGHHGFFSSRFFLLCIVVFALLIISISAFYVRKTHAFLPSVASLYEEWNQKKYLSVYEKSGLILNKRPLDGSILALHGFSAYYLFAEQNNPANAQIYLVESINYLRNSWYRVSDSEKPQIAYVLGKAYYQRGYYYADLAIKYLDFAYNAGIHYDDLSEFRGLAFSLLGKYSESIEAFTESLANNPSDLLLFTLSQNYLNVDDMDSAKRYLYETIRTTNDELLHLKCRYFLGTIFISEARYEEAQTEFDAIIQKDPNSADAHYGLGVIYENQGDLIRARSEWRKAIKLNPIHLGARTKLNL